MSLNQQNVVHKLLCFAWSQIPYLGFWLPFKAVAFPILKTKHCYYSEPLKVDNK